MRSIGHLRTHRSRTFIAGIAVASVLAFGMGVVPAGASKQLSASESSFCKTLLSFKAKEPTGTSYTAYQKWAKTYLPFWEKLASEAPSSGFATARRDWRSVRFRQPGRTTYSPNS